jgi:FMN reductase
LRTVAHALRGWPTPLSVTVWDRVAEFGSTVDERLAGQLRIMLGQILTMSWFNVRQRRRMAQVATVR